MIARTKHIEDAKKRSGLTELLAWELIFSAMTYKLSSSLTSIGI